MISRENVFCSYQLYTVTMRFNHIALRVKNIGFRHICFTVADIHKTRKSLNEKGVIFDSEILSMRDKNLAMYVFDPENNKIEIVETGVNSPQFRFQKK